MSLSIPRGKAFIRYSFRLTWRFEMKKDSLTWSWAKWWLQPGEMWHICRVKEQHSLSQRFVLSFFSFGTNVVSWICSCVCVPFIVNWKLLVRTCPFQLFRTVIAPSSANNYPWPGTCKCWRKVKCIESISELKSDNKEHKAKTTGVYFIQCHSS